MRTVNMTGWKVLCCAAFSLSGCLFHKPAFHPAQVLMKDGATCFSVANNREERANPPEISVITVSSETEERKGPLWYRAFRSQAPMTLSPHECLVYGEDTGHTPALRQGFRYRVTMNAYINEKTHHAKWNNKINGRDWRICEQ